MRLTRRSLSTALLAAPLLVASLLAGPGRAEAAAPSHPVVVRVINLNRILDRLDEKADRERELEKFLHNLEASVNAIKEQLDAERKDMTVLATNGPDYAAKREEVLRLAARYQAEGQTAKLLAEDKKKVMQLDLFQKMSDAVRDYAKRENIDLVLNDDSDEKIPDTAPAAQTMAAMASRRVMFSSRDIDISDDIALAMNNAYKLSGGFKPVEPTASSGGAAGGKPASAPAPASGSTPAPRTP